MGCDSVIAARSRSPLAARDSLESHQGLSEGGFTALHSSAAKHVHVCTFRGAGGAKGRVCFRPCWVGGSGGVECVVGVGV